MDKLRFLFTAGVLAVLLAGCVADVINEGPGPIAGQNGDMEFVIGIASPTRVSTGANFRSAWEDGDEIGIFAVASGASLVSSGNYIHNAKLTYNGTTWTQATPLYWPTTASGISALDFYAYYPYDDNGGSPQTLDPTGMTFKVKTDQSGETNGQSNYSLSDLLTARSDNGGAGWAKSSTVALTFSHALAMVQLTIDDAVGALDSGDEIAVTLLGVKSAALLHLGTPEVAASDEASNITMYRVEQSGDADYPTSFTFRGLVPAQTLAAGSSLFRIANGDLLLSGSALTADITMAAGQAEKFTQTIPHPADGTVQPEANSYMVEPNGGAIYIPVSQANKAADPNYNLGAATDGLGGVTADNYTVELVWGDTPVGAGGVLTEIGAKQYVGKGYVYVKPGAAGNAVVCVKVGGAVKWSWHIWVTDPVGSATDTDPASGLTWMDRNLGAGGAGSYQANGKNGLYYQWGRKDAFPGSDGIDNNQTYYTPADPTGTTAALPTGSYTELPGMVQNPLTFAANWQTYLGSLNVGNDNKSWSDGGAKTLYDPCPAGWRVPENGKWSGGGGWINGSNTEWAAFANNGRVFNGVNGTAALGHFYPAASYRSTSSGAMDYVGQYGVYWSATPTGTSAYYLVFYSSYVNPSNNHNRSNGFSVRCVAE